VTNENNESIRNNTNDTDVDGPVVDNNEAAQDMQTLGLFNQREKFYERAVGVASFCVVLAIAIGFFKIAQKCGLTSNEPGCRG